MDRLAVIIDWKQNSNLHALLLKLLELDNTPSNKQRFVVSKQAALGQQNHYLTSIDNTLFIASDVRIDNRGELCDLLKNEINPQATLCDDLLILCAYQKWGRECPKYLCGDFAFVIWDSHRAKLFAAVDGLHMRTLNYFSTSNGFCIASEGQQLLNHPDLSPAINELGVAAWLSGWPDPNISMFDSVMVLPSGHYLEANGRDISIRKFWDIDPEKQIRYPSHHEYAEHFQQLLRVAVKDRMASYGSGTATQMSGGMDSTSVTAIAREIATSLDKQHVVLSHTYPAGEKCDETADILKTLNYLNINDYRLLPVNRYENLDFRALYPPVFESPGTVLSPRYIDEIKLLKELDINVLLTGSGGDEMTWGHSLTYSQRLRRGELSVIGEVFTGCREMNLPVLGTLRQLFIHPFVPGWVKHLLGRPFNGQRIPVWIPEKTIERLNLRERILNVQSPDFRNPALQARYRALMQTSTLNSVRSYAEAGREYSVDVRHPFFDKRIVEFSFAIPDDLWIREGYPKWLLRKAMNDHLPGSVCWNRNKVIFDSFFARIINDQNEVIRQILSDTRLQGMGLIDNQKLLSAFDAVIAGKGRNLTVDLLYAILTQIWFQKFWFDV
jgi:asparagine synthetase B (glutamine-hydrolysing)